MLRSTHPNRCFQAHTWRASDLLSAVIAPASTSLLVPRAHSLTSAAAKFVHVPISPPLQGSSRPTEHFSRKLTFWWQHPWRKRLEGTCHAVVAEAGPIAAPQGSTDSQETLDTTDSEVGGAKGFVEGYDNGVGRNGAETNGAATKSDRPEQLRFSAAAAVIPHPEKVGKGGEDAFFISDDGLAVGIADGVGSWIERNVDPGLYSRMLMDKAKEAATKVTNYAEPSEDAARLILVKAHKQTELMGSSTACVVVLDGSKLRAANLGDSGFMVLRKDQIRFVSPPQQHSFNFPYQMAGPDCAGDSPWQAEKYELDMKKGDVLVLTTDGVSDNVWPQEAAAVVSTVMKRGGSPSVAAAGLANFARYRSQEQTHITPFAYGAQQAGMTFGGGRPYLGGKPDDITVVIAVVTGASKL